MPKLLSRTVAFLLTICLLADSIAAASLHVSAISSSQPFHKNIFSEQALVARARYSSRQIIGMIAGSVPDGLHSFFNETRIPRVGKSVETHSSRIGLRWPIRWEPVPVMLPFDGTAFGPLLNRIPKLQSPIFFSENHNPAGQFKEPANEVLELCERIEKIPAYRTDQRLQDVIKLIRLKIGSLNPAETGFIAHRGPRSVGRFSRLLAMVELHAPPQTVAGQARSFLESFDSDLKIFRDAAVIPGTNIRIMVGEDTEKEVSAEPLIAIQNALEKLRATSTSAYEFVTTHLTTIRIEYLEGAMASSPKPLPGVMKLEWPMSTDLDVSVELPLAILEEVAHMYFSNRYSDDSDLISTDFKWWELPHSVIGDSYVDDTNPISHLDEVHASLVVIDYLEGLPRQEGDSLIQNEIETLKEKLTWLLTLQGKEVFTTQGQSIVDSAIKKVKQYDGSRRSNTAHPASVSAEPMNAYTARQNALLQSAEVTSDSRRLRQILAEVGSGVETYIRGRLKNDQVHIALVSVGSSLKGYAGTESDLEYVVFVIDGLTGQSQILDSDIERSIYSEIDRRIDAMAGKEIAELKRNINWRINNYSEITDGSFNAPQYVEVGGFKMNMRKVFPFEWEKLFLPPVYGDSQRLERARRNLIQHISQSRELWPSIQNAYADYIQIIPADVSKKPHLRRWLEGQQVDTHSPEAIGTFNDNRRQRLGLPDIEQMAEIYREMGNETHPERPIDVKRTLAERFGIRIFKLQDKFYVRPTEIPNAPWVMSGRRAPERGPLYRPDELPRLTLIAPLEECPWLSLEDPGTQSDGVYIALTRELPFPVAVKVISKGRQPVHVQTELEVAQRTGKEGIHPRFYGIVALANGQTAYAMQVARFNILAPDHYGTHRENIEALYVTVEELGLKGFGPNSVRESPEGNVFLIDAGNYRIVDPNKFYLTSTDSTALDMTWLRRLARSILQFVMPNPPELLVTGIVSAIEPLMLGKVGWSQLSLVPSAGFGATHTGRSKGFQVFAAAWGLGVMYGFHASPLDFWHTYPIIAAAQFAVNLFLHYAPKRYPNLFNPKVAQLYLRAA
jgi:hypothetical protein